MMCTKKLYSNDKKTQKTQWAVKIKLPKLLSYRKCEDSVAYFKSPVLKM